MATVQDILAKKGGNIISVPPQETVLRAAQLMNERAIGGLVVTDGGRLAGIFTERDILRRVVAQRLDPAVPRVAHVVTTPPPAGAPHSPGHPCAPPVNAKRTPPPPPFAQPGLGRVISLR